jgi:RNA polymerase sigma-70 factor (ECF subfamily)
MSAAATLARHDLPLDAAAGTSTNAADYAHEDAFEELVKQNGGRMLSCARRMMGNEEDAHDVVQETFLLAFRSLPRFQGRAKVSTWMHRIVVNTALTALRRRKRRPEIMIEDLLPDFGDDGCRLLTDRDSADLCAAARLETEETRAAVRRCIDRLPDAYRVVLVLRDLEDHGTEEVARMLEVRNGTVKVRLHRARQALRTLLQAELGCSRGRATT